MISAAVADPESSGVGAGRENSPPSSPPPAAGLGAGGYSVAAAARTSRDAITSPRQRVRQPTCAASTSADLRQKNGA